MWRIPEDMKDDFYQTWRIPEAFKNSRFCNMRFLAAVDLQPPKELDSLEARAGEDMRFMHCTGFQHFDSDALSLKFLRTGFTCTTILTPTPVELTSWEADVLDARLWFDNSFYACLFCSTVQPLEHCTLASASSFGFGFLRAASLHLVHCASIQLISECMGTHNII